MVVKVASSVLENFSNENSENENSRKTQKVSRRTPAKLQRKNKILGGSHYNSPSKKPLTTSSLVNINNDSPLKHPQTILPRTPIKQEIKYESNLLLDSPPSVSSPCSSSESPNSSSSPEFHANGGTFPCRSINAEDTSGSCMNRLSPIGSNNQQKPPPLSRRNARERNRVKQVSMGFSLLRQHVPQINRKKKLSKVETLRGAVDYIRGLEALLQEHPHPTPNQPKNHAQTYLSEQNTNQYIQVPINPTSTQTPAGVPPGYTLHHVRGNSISLQQEGHQHQSSFYEDRLHQFQMSGSCLEPQILKVPKIEDQYHSAPIYSTSVYSIPTMSYGKHYDGTTTMEAMASHQDSKEPLTAIVQGIQECNQSVLPAKEPGEIELLEALAWWQHNS